MADRGAMKDARKAQQEQEMRLQKQRANEEARTADLEQDIARRKKVAGGRSGGRSLLIQTSPTGTKQNLGA